MFLFVLFFFFQAEDGIRDWSVTGVQTCALPIFSARGTPFCRFCSSRCCGSCACIFSTQTKHGDRVIGSDRRTPRRVRRTLFTEQTTSSSRGSAVRSARCSREKPQRAEALPIHADFLLGDPFADEPRGDRRQQDAAAKMSGGHEQAFEVGWPQDRKMVRGVGSQASPGFLDACILQSGSQLDGCGKNLLDAVCRDVLDETYLPQPAPRN